MSEAIPILGKKKKICELCGRYAHPFTTRCEYNDLTSRIKNLLDKNAMIPVLTNQNREILQMATMYQTQFDNITKALVLCEEVVMGYENGNAIWKKFQERLADILWPRISHPDTAESPKTSAPESTTLSETESKPCTEGMILGGTTPGNSSRLTANATLVEQKPPLSIT